MTSDEVELVFAFTVRGGHGVVLRAPALFQELGFKVLESHGRAVGGAAMLMFHVVGPTDQGDALRSRMDELISVAGELPRAIVFEARNNCESEYRLELRAVYSIELLGTVVRLVGKAGGTLFHHSVSLECVRDVEIACHRFGIRLPIAKIGDVNRAVLLENWLREDALPMGLGRIDLKSIVSALD